jgi:hypothetical protein
MAEGNPRIAPTAHFTAQAWVREKFPNAHHFDTRTGRTLFDGASLILAAVGRWSPPPIRFQREYLFIRHHAFEARLREIDPHFVLEVGAGLSPRGLTFSRENPDLTYIEVDLPGMVAAKSSCLAGVDLPANYHLASVDLLGTEFTASLPARPEQGQRIAVITEGVTDYLDMNEKRIAWANLAGFLREFGGGSYLYEIHPKELYAKHRGGAFVLTSLLGVLTGQRFGDRIFERIDDALDMVRDCGFDEAIIHDLERLNTSRHRPPMHGCPWALVEATVG